MRARSKDVRLAFARMAIATQSSALVTDEETQESVRRMGSERAKKFVFFDYLEAQKKKAYTLNHDADGWKLGQLDGQGERRIGPVMTTREMLLALQLMEAFPKEQSW